MGRAFTQTDQRQLVAGAARAPSAHNVQPARWCFTRTGHIRLVEDRARLLPVADPAGADHRLGLGAACEAMSIAASRLGYELSEPELEGSVSDNGGRFRTVAEIGLSGRRNVDPDARLIHVRSTFRGVFKPLNDGLMFRLRAIADACADLHLVIDRHRLDDLSHLHDECSMEFLRRPEFVSELYGWLRFNHQHPDWNRDGLNGDALRLLPMERHGASVLMRPKVFRVADACGLAGRVMSEERVSRSASAMLVMSAAAKKDRFEIGRRFYRSWLAVTGLGLGACPMSALVDHPRGNQALARLVGLREGRVLVNVFRIGLAPLRVTPTPRLPVEELIIDERELDQLQEFQ